MSYASSTPGRAIVVFDGDCVFCHRAVRFIHARDREGRFRFAARQSAAGTRVLAATGVGVEPNSMVLIDETGTWLRSDAVLRVAAGLGRPWSAVRILLLVPAVLRDPVYRLVSAVRHRVARHLTCDPPDAALRARILE